MATSFLACFPSNIHSSCYYLVLIQSWVVGAAMILPEVLQWGKSAPLFRAQSKIWSVPHFSTIE